MNIQTDFIYKHDDTRNNWKVTHINEHHVTAVELEAGCKSVKSPTGESELIPAKEKTVTRATFEGNVRAGRLIPNEQINNIITGLNKKRKKA